MNPATGRPPCSVNPETPFVVGSPAARYFVFVGGCFGYAQGSALARCKGPRRAPPKKLLCNFRNPFRLLPRTSPVGQVCILRCNPHTINGQKALPSIRRG